MKLIGKIVCLFKGHKRGKRVYGHPSATAYSDNVRIYACPRCSNETRYKVKPS